MKSGRFVLKVSVFALAAVAAMALVVYATQLLWNWLVPELFHGPVVTYWQTLGLLALTKIFFWSFSKGGGHWKHRSGPWGQAWSQKWQGMSQEDRERFKQKMKDKWCSPDQNAGSSSTGSANG